MKIYICEDCGDEGPCRLEVPADTQPPNTCPYRYGAALGSRKGMCNWFEWGPENDLDPAAGR